MPPTRIERLRTYTDDEVRHILFHSEGRPTTAPRNEPGHSGQKHVLLSNPGLQDRGGKMASAVPVACAFASTPEEIRAVREALNSDIGQLALGYLDETYPTGVRVRIEARVTAVGVRYSSGQEPRAALVDSVLLIVDRSEVACCFGLQIQTAFPILAFKRGRPAWLDARNQWHDSEDAGGGRRGRL